MGFQGDRRQLIEDLIELTKQRQPLHNIHTLISLCDAATQIVGSDRESEVPELLRRAIADLVRENQDKALEAYEAVRASQPRRQIPNEWVFTDAQLARIRLATFGEVLGAGSTARLGRLIQARGESEYAHTKIESLSGSRWRLARQRRAALWLPDIPDDARGVRRQTTQWPKDKNEEPLIAGVFLDALAERVKSNAKAGLTTTGRVEPSTNPQPLHSDERHEPLSEIDVAGAPLNGVAATKQAAKPNDPEHDSLNAALLNHAKALAGTIKIGLAEQERNLQLGHGYALPVSWSVVTGELADHFENVLRGTDGSPEMLSGSFEEVLAVYSRVPSGRLVILGGPGAGKSVLVWRLAFDLIKSPARQHLVPVTINAANWGDEDKDFRAWAVRQVIKRYPIETGSLWFPGKKKTRIVTQMLNDGLLLLIVDGFDEVRPDLQPAFLQAINDGLGSNDKLVLTSRLEEYRAAVNDSGPLKASGVIRLDPLKPDEILEYLKRGTPGTLADGELSTSWERLWTLADEKETSSQGSRAAEISGLLSAPFYAAIARSAYDSQKANATELLDTKSYPDSASITRRLLDRFFDAAYKNADGGKARDLLRLIARRIKQHGEQDIAWWSLVQPTTRAVKRISQVVLGGGFAIFMLAVLLSVIALARGHTSLPYHAGDVAIAAMSISALYVPLIFPKWFYLWFSALFDLGFEHYSRLRRIGLLVTVGPILGIAIFNLVLYAVDGTLDPRLYLWVSVFGCGTTLLANPSLAASIGTRVWFLACGRTMQSPNSFLLDAHETSILRRVGRIYQFRHQLLFDYLLNDDESSKPVQQ